MEKGCRYAAALSVLDALSVQAGRTNIQDGMRFCTKDYLLTDQETYAKLKISKEESGGTY